MCGITGYVGERQAQSILLAALLRLEYRGYDSCGIAVSENDIKMYKDAVRIEALAKMMPALEGTAGVGHTRWATHGKPSQINAHPHLDCTGNIAVVHNGIITNYQTLRQQLTAEGHKLISETDTEVIPHLIENHYYKNGQDLEQALEAAVSEVEGSYAIIVLAASESRLVVARKDSPLIIGVGDRENFIASDVSAILDYTNRVIYLEDGDIGVVTKDCVRIKRHGAKVDWKEHRIQWSIDDAQRGGYRHFMLKEIHEQPKVIRDTLAERLSAEARGADLAIMRRDISPLPILACGTSYHAALIGKHIMEEILGIPVSAELASEFNYAGFVPPKAGAIAITQSGETADTLKAMRKVKEGGHPVLAITNVADSTATRIADQTMYIRAGPEISVAATKSFLGQLMALYWLAISHSREESKKMEDLTSKLRQLPEKVQQVLDSEDKIREQATYLSKFNNAFFIGRGINFAAALEGALKLKEISYIHAEGYAAGELKHGPFALLDKNTPVIAIAAKDDTYEAIMSNIKEVKAREAPVIAVAEEGDDAVKEVADAIIAVPQVDVIFSPVVNSVALQLLAYYTARERNCPIDFPRNLAKSVTVE